MVHLYALVCEDDYKHTECVQFSYTGFTSWEKTFTNCLKIDFGGENFCRFAVIQFATPTNMHQNVTGLNLRTTKARDTMSELQSYMVESITLWLPSRFLSVPSLWE